MDWLSPLNIPDHYCCECGKKIRLLQGYKLIKCTTKKIKEEEEDGEVLH